MSSAPVQPWRRLLGLIAALMLATSQPLMAASTTLNLKDADINALIGTVSEITGKNFIIDPRVKGRVTVISSEPMNEDEVWQVFLSILAVHGFAAIPAGPAMKIIPDVNAKQDSVYNATDKNPGTGDEIVTRVIQVDNVAAAQLVPILRPLVPQQGHLAAYPPTNMLIISDHADNAARLVAIIRRMDQESDSEVEVIPLQNASATEVARILTNLVRTGGGPAAAAAAAAGGAPTIVADERTNSILLGGERSDRLRLRAIIAHLDTPMERGGNTHVIYLKYAKAADLVETLTGVSKSLVEEEKQGQGQQAARKVEAGLNIQADESTNALVINAPPDVFRSLQAVVRQLDVRRAQVMVEAVIAELRADRAKELGVQWRFATDFEQNGVLGGTNFTTGGNGSSINAVAQNPLATGNGLSVGYFEGTSSFGGNDFLNLGALVRLLASDGNTNILSTPTLVTLDNQEAEIVVAQNVPFQTGSFTNTGAAQGAVNPFTTIQREDVGLTLRVTPQINEGDAIQLDIEQEQSSLTNSTGDAGSRITNKRSIKTAVLVEDGQVVVLGGLIQDQVNESVQKIPLLGDMPLVGHLFSSKRGDKTKQNLMVFLRPSIVRDAVTYSNVSAGKYDYIRAQQLEDKLRGRKLMRTSDLPLLPRFEDAEDLPWLRKKAEGGAVPPPGTVAE